MASVKQAQPVNIFVSANVSFALDVYRQLSAMTPGDNMFVSPLSISIALAMTYLGARGDSASQMKTTLRLENLSDTVIHAGFSELLKTMNDPYAPYTLRTANRLFAGRQHQFLDEFISATKTLYGAEAALSDFARDPDGARLAINKWVEEQTAERIQDLLPSGSVDGQTVMVLVNAIYFKGDWASKFDVRDTGVSPFNVNAQTKTDVEMMFQHGKYRMTIDRALDCQVIALPYVGDHLGMFVLLPRQQDGLDTLEKSLTVDGLQGILRDISSARLVDVDVYLPKFRLEQTCPLKEVLIELGVRDLFVAGAADLSGMDGSRELYVSSAVHKAFIDVTEEGSEAAAATALGINMLSMAAAPARFVANHPFMFLIADSRSESILFLGRLASPASV